MQAPRELWPPPSTLLQCSSCVCFLPQPSAVCSRTARATGVRQLYPIAPFADHRDFVLLDTLCQSSSALCSFPLSASPFRTYRTPSSSDCAAFIAVHLCCPLCPECRSSSSYLLVFASATALHLPQCTSVALCARVSFCPLCSTMQPSVAQPAELAGVGHTACRLDDPSCRRSAVYPGGKSIQPPGPYQRMASTALLRMLKSEYSGRSERATS